MIRYTIIIVMLLSFVGCNSVGIRPPLFEDCRMLTSSIFCVDKRLNNSRIDLTINYIQSQDILSIEQKDDLIAYFDDNRRNIILKKEFEIDFNYIGFFRGYNMTNPKDRLELENFMDEKLNELEKFRKKCGPYRDGRIICN